MNSFQRSYSQSNYLINSISETGVKNPKKSDESVLNNQVEDGYIINPLIIEGKKGTQIKIFNKMRNESFSSTNLFPKKYQRKFINNNLNSNLDFDQKTNSNIQSFLNEESTYDNLIEAELQMYYLNSPNEFSKEDFLILCESLGLLSERSQFSIRELLDHLWTIGTCRKSKADKEIIFELLNTILITSYMMDENILMKIFRCSQKYLKSEIENLNLNMKKMYSELFQKK